MLWTLGLLDSIDHLVGASGLLIGIPLLVIASVIGAFVYRAIGTTDPLKDDVTDPVTGVTMGLCFGLFVWLVGIVVLVPLWLRLLSFDTSIPFVHWESLIGLLVYGGLVGPLYPLVSDRLRR